MCFRINITKNWGPFECTLIGIVESEGVQNAAVSEMKEIFGWSGS
jgi:hypothetical protein